MSEGCATDVRKTTSQLMFELSPFLGMTFLITQMVGSLLYSVLTVLDGSKLTFPLTKRAVYCLFCEQQYYVKTM